MAHMLMLNVIESIWIETILEWHWALDVARGVRKCNFFLQNWSAVGSVKANLLIILSILSYPTQGSFFTGKNLFKCQFLPTGLNRQQLIYNIQANITNITHKAINSLNTTFKESFNIRFVSSSPKTDICAFFTCNFLFFIPGRGRQRHICQKHVIFLLNNLFWEDKSENVSLILVFATFAGKNWQKSVFAKWF